MCTELRCNDCRLAQHDGKKLRCTETNTYVSPFATVCGKFKSKGKNTIGSGLIKILKTKHEVCIDCVHYERIQDSTYHCALNLNGSPCKHYDNDWYAWRDKGGRKE